MPDSAGSREPENDMSTATTNDGTTIHFEIEGDWAKPTLLFSNSLGTDLHMWDAQVAALADDFRILRYDGRGHGLSSAPAGPYTIERLGNDALAVLDAAAISRADFCGVSMGGMIGMWLGVHAPERFGRMALCNTSAYLPPRESWDERIEKARAGRMDEIARDVIERWFTPGFREREPEEVARVREQFLNTSGEGYAGCCAAIRDMDQRESIRDFGVPALVIAGGVDPAAPPEHAHLICDRIPDAAYVEIADGAHLSNIEKAEAFNAALRAFLLEE